MIKLWVIEQAVPPNESCSAWKVLSSCISVWIRSDGNNVVNEEWPSSHACGLFCVDFMLQMCCDTAVLHSLLPLLYCHSVCFVHSALSEEEKTLLRAGLITNFNEPVNQVGKEYPHSVIYKDFCIWPLRYDVTVHFME